MSDEDVEFVYEDDNDSYDPATCVTAGELRARGIMVPEDIPDCGWVRRGALQAREVGVAQAPDGSYQGVIEVSFTEPFRWVEGEFDMEGRA